MADSDNAATSYQFVQPSTAHSSVGSGNEGMLDSGGGGAPRNNQDQAAPQQDVTGSLNLPCFNPDDGRRKSRRVKKAPAKFGGDTTKLDRVANGYEVVGKIKDPKYTRHNLIRTFENGNELSLEYLQRNGFDAPMLFRNRDGLGKLFNE